MTELTPNQEIFVSALEAEIHKYGFSSMQPKTSPSGVVLVGRKDGCALTVSAMGLDGMAPEEIEYLASARAAMVKDELRRAKRRARRAA